MKKFFEGLVCFAGAVIVIGSIGSMEMDYISVGETICRIAQGMFLILVSRGLKSFRMNSERTSRKTVENCAEKTQIISFRQSA